LEEIGAGEDLLLLVLALARGCAWGCLATVACCSARNQQRGQAARACILAPGSNDRVRRLPGPQCFD